MGVSAQACGVARARVWAWVRAELRAGWVAHVYRCCCTGLGGHPFMFLVIVGFSGCLESAEESAQGLSKEGCATFVDVSRMATRVTAPSRTMKYICAAVLNLRKGGWDDSLTHLKHAYAAALGTNRTLHREALRYDNISRFTTCVSGRITSAGQMSWPTHFGHHH